jgi:hypothetical protein
MIFGFALLMLSLVGILPLARGAAVDTLVMTSAGDDTAFTITGIFPSDFHIASYSAPGAPYTLTFNVPTNPTSFAFEDPIGLFVLSTGVVLNGVIYPDSQAAFFTSDLGGGLDVCVSEACSPDPPTIAPRFVVFTKPVQLFTGTLGNPVFLSGPIGVDQNQTLIQAPVPEPGSLTAVLLGMTLFGVTLLAGRTKKPLPRPLVDA